MIVKNECEEAIASSQLKCANVKVHILNDSVPHTFVISNESLTAAVTFDFKRPHYWCSLPCGCGICGGIRAAALHIGRDNS